MAVLSKFLTTGNKHSAGKRCFARYRNNKKVFPGSIASDLFYSPPSSLLFCKCSDIRCKTCPNASTSQIINDPTSITFCKASNVIYKISCNICNLAYIGETSNELHLRINQHRSDSHKFSPSSNYLKSTIELKHFHLHNFKNTTIEILNIQKNLSERLFLESSYMKFFNTIYPYGLNSELFNKTVKTFSTLDIKSKNLKYQNDYLSIYSLLNHQLNKKTTRTKRGKSKNSKIISKSMIVKEINLLQKEFSSNFNWLSVRKFLF